MFPELCIQLDHDLKKLPDQEIILVDQSDNADGSFVSYHYLALYLRGAVNPKVYVIACKRSVSHYNNVLARLGVQLMRNIEQQKCQFFNVADICNRSDWNEFPIQKIFEVRNSMLETVYTGEIPIVLSLLRCV